MQTIRRVVTGHDENGVAIVISDGPTPNVVQPGNRPGVALSNFWQTNSSPATVSGTEDTATQNFNLEPPPNGAIFRTVEFSPEAGWIDDLDRKTARESFASIGAGHAADPTENPPHPLMHRTKTIDYAVVLSGEIYMVLDKSEVLVRAGDVIVQRGTNHAWSNRSDAPCVIAFILIDSQVPAELA